MMKNTMKRSRDQAKSRSFHRLALLLSFPASSRLQLPGWDRSGKRKDRGVIRWLSSLHALPVVRTLFFIHLTTMPPTGSSHSHASLPGSYGLSFIFTSLSFHLPFFLSFIILLSFSFTFLFHFPFRWGCNSHVNPQHSPRIGKRKEGRKMWKSEGKKHWKGNDGLCIDDEWEACRLPSSQSLPTLDSSHTRLG